MRAEMKFKSIKDWKIGQKIKFITFLAPICFLLLIFIYIIPKINQEFHEQKEEEIKHIVEIAHKSAEHYYSRFAKGELSEEEAKQNCINTINDLRFGKNDYFWINDLNVLMVNHPLKKELNGQSLKNISDPDGKKLFVEAVDIAKTKGEGILEYKWPKPGKTEPVNKKSYIKLLIGSGIYIDHIETEISDFKLKVILFMIIVATGTIILGFYVARLLTKPIEVLTAASHEMANGNLEVRIFPQARDEIGELTENFSTMAEKIKSQLDYLDKLPLPVLLINIDFEIEYINKTGAELLKKDRSELVGKKCYDLCKTDDCNTEKCACAQAMKKDQTVTEETIARPSGIDVPILYTASPIKDKNGKIVAALESITDIVEIKEMQNYLNRSTKKMLLIK